MRPIVKRLGFTSRSKNREIYERHQARAIAAQQSYERMKEMRNEGLLSEHAWEILRPAIERQIEVRREVVHEIMQADPSIESAELERAFQEVLRTQRSTYNTLLSDGIISEDIFARLVAEVDNALLNEDVSFGDMLLRRPKDQPPVTKLIFASVNETDAYESLHMLGILGIPVTRLTSHLGPGGQLSLTMLIGVEEEQVDEVIETIMKCCDDEPEVRRGLFGLFGAQTATEGKSLEKSSVFVFDVEHFEEI
jgi:uncharacterized protein YaaQ